MISTSKSIVILLFVLAVSLGSCGENPKTDSLIENPDSMPVKVLTTDSNNMPVQTLTDSTEKMPNAYDSTKNK